MEFSNWEELCYKVDKFFPFKDKNGNPLYRKHQREAILKILKAFYIDGNKYVAVDGPVGCGKSAINYTVSMITGNTIYLTPLKMLQDQIALEGWKDLKILKGRGSYCCNYTGYEKIDIRSNYSGDEFAMCLNSKERNYYSSKTLKKISFKVKEIFRQFKNNSFIRSLRTGFESPEEVDSIYEPAREFLMKCKKKIAISLTGSSNNVKYDYDVEKNIACSMDDEHECPAKTAKLLAQLAKIRVLNPDIFFLLNINGGFYSKNELMVYDECQQIEGVINRIFKAKLPIETIKKLFGIDMTYLYKIDELNGLLTETNKFIFEELGPALAATKTISRIGEVCSIRNFPTLQRIRSKSIFAKSFQKSYNGFLFDKWQENSAYDLSVLNIINYITSGKDVPLEIGGETEFSEMVRGYFLLNYTKYNCTQFIDLFEKMIPACRKRYREDVKYRLRSKKTIPLTKEENENGRMIDDVIVSEDIIFADHMNIFAKSVENFVSNIMMLTSISKDDLPAFTVSKTIEPSINICRDTPLFSEISDKLTVYDKEKCLEIIPIAIGRIMHAFFYSKAEKVLLTSGTWVKLDSVFKIYGLPKDDTKFIKIPSTFELPYRPIYVLQNKGFTDFSEKNSEGLYIYKTENGIKKFTLEVSSMVNRVRKFIADHHKKNANIIVHCHTFDIAHKIAEYAPGVDESFLIHLQIPGMYIDNKITKYRILSCDKNSLIQKMRDNPNSGLTIISPSISEGVDFKDDIARAQILLKRPIPYLGDVYVRSHYKGNPEVGIERDPDFLDRVCYTIMTQAYGRIVRSSNDWGYTIIMDQSIARSLKYLVKESCKKVDDLNINYFFDGLNYNIDERGFPIFKWIFG